MPDEPNISDPAGHHTSFEELEAATAVVTPVKLSEIKLDSDEVPEEFRGKNAAELVGLLSEMKRGMEQAKTTIDTLRTSSQALAEVRAAPAPVAAPVPITEAEPTAADMKKLFEDDPFAYHEKQYAMMGKRLSQTLDSKITPLVGTTASAAEHAARAKFPEEFELLGGEIRQIIETIPPEGRTALAAPGAWEQVVEYARGKHFDKFLSGRDAKKKGVELEAARKREADGAGMTFTDVVGGRGGPRSGPLVELTQEMKDAAKTLGISEADYKKYYI